MEYMHRTVGDQLRMIRKRPVVTSNRMWEEGGITARSQAGLNDTIVLDDPHRLAYEFIQQDVLQFYDFIAITERWAESMVVMKLLLDEYIEYQDLVVLKAKESGTKSKKNQGRKLCEYIPIARKLPDVEEYFEDEYPDSNPDYLLYAAVNRSLDLTIEMLGRDKVERGVQIFADMQKLATEECLSKAIFPCSKDGVWQPGYKNDCYSKDFGCGYKCVDMVLARYIRLNNLTSSMTP